MRWLPAGQYGPKDKDGMQYEFCQARVVSYDTVIDMDGHQWWSPPRAGRGETDGAIDALRFYDKTSNEQRADDEHRHQTVYAVSWAARRQRALGRPAPLNGSTRISQERGRGHWSSLPPVTRLLSMSSGRSGNNSWQKNSPFSRGALGPSVTLVEHGHKKAPPKGAETVFIQLFLL